MGLNKQKGNMYAFVTHTFNVVKGKCPHDCDYCFMKVYKQNPVRFDTTELKTELGFGNYIFVGSSCDMWAKEIPTSWINMILLVCHEYPENTYLFQSKNPERFKEFMNFMPPKFVLATTIETNRGTKDVSKAPEAKERARIMAEYVCKKTITIEPIMDFDLGEFVSMIKNIKPDFVSIGANSKEEALDCHLFEPSGDKVRVLIEELKKFTEVRVKSNLNRILKE